MNDTVTKDSIIEACERGVDAWAAHSLTLLAKLKVEQQEDGSAKAHEVAFLSTYLAEMYCSLVLRFGVKPMRLMIPVIVQNGEMLAESISAKAEKEDD